MATAYRGTYLGVDDEAKQEFQGIIDLALLEINNGLYEKAILLLGKAKELYGGSKRAEELQELIIKLQKNYLKAKEPKMKNNWSSSFIYQRKLTLSEEKQSPGEYRPQNEYTSEQLSLVNKINNCRNYYQVLSVTIEASQGEIKRAYKKLALLLHPDKNHAPGAAEAFKTLGNAVTILMDVKKRKEYDLCCVDYTSPNVKTFNFYESTSSQQEYYGYGHPHHYHSSAGTAYGGSEEFISHEFFHRFFGNYRSSQSHYRRRPYQPANQRQPQEHGQQPSMAFSLLLLMVLMTMIMSLFSTDPLYSLSHSSKYNVRRQTQHLSVPYFVKRSFDNEYQGSLERLENSVEEDYIYTMKQHCLRERSYREIMMARARSFGSRAQIAQAQGLKMPSCDNLSKVGVTRYSLY